MNVDMAKIRWASIRKAKVFLRLGRRTRKSASSGKNVTKQIFTKKYADVFKGDSNWQDQHQGRHDLYVDKKSTYVNPPYFVGMKKAPKIARRYCRCARTGAVAHSITTDHISPAGSIKVDSPAGKYLVAQRSSLRTSINMVRAAAIMK
jgi:aconitase A